MGSFDADEVVDGSVSGESERLPDQLVCDSFHTHACGT